MKPMSKVLSVADCPETLEEARVVIRDMDASLAAHQRAQRSLRSHVIELRWLWEQYLSRGDGSVGNCHVTAQIDRITRLVGVGQPPGA